MITRGCKVRVVRSYNEADEYCIDNCIGEVISETIDEWGYWIVAFPHIIMKMPPRNIEMIEE